MSRYTWSSSFEYVDKIGCIKLTEMPPSSKCLNKGQRIQFNSLFYQYTMLPLGWWPSSNSSKRAGFELVKNYTSIISYCSQLPSKFTRAELVMRDYDSHITVSCPLSQRIFCGHEKNLLSEISTFSRYLYNCLKNPF